MPVAYNGLRSVVPRNNIEGDRYPPNLETLDNSDIDHNNGTSRARVAKRLAMRTTHSYRHCDVSHVYIYNTPLPSGITPSVAVFQNFSYFLCLG
jgi:hypothetical protein